MTLKTFSHPELVEKFPPEVKKLFQIFGSKIRLVGGAVRDLLIEKEIKDFDFATELLPQQVIEILVQNKITAVPTGVKFGTITAVVNHKNFEITTLRKDNNQQGRHCDVEFVDDYFLDAQRRDFTMNALYLDSHGSIDDYFEGITDLKNQKVRFIGDAESRITEDFLRILRFFRFTCGYGEELDPQGFAACVSQKNNLKKLSRERIRQEFVKLISSKNFKKLLEILRVIEGQKITDEIFSSKLDIAAFERVLNLRKDVGQKLKIAALFLHEKLDLEIFFREICATNEEKKYFRFLSSGPQKLDLPALKQLLAFYEKELVIELYLFSWAKESTKQLEYLEYLQDFSLPNFPLKPQDLINAGLSRKKLGEALSEAKKFWAKCDFKADKNTLLNFVV